jgi:hypothetical protein
MAFQMLRSRAVVVKENKLHTSLFDPAKSSENIEHTTTKNGGLIG